MIKFLVLKASDDEYETTIEINLLEELMNFLDTIEYSVIIGKEYNFETNEVENTLIIYDDYLE